MNKPLKYSYLKPNLRNICYKTLAVQEYCEQNKITLLFLPPYSPEFNPIERVWSFLKSKIRQRFFKTVKAFKSFIFDLFTNINQTDTKEMAKQCVSLINS